MEVALEWHPSQTMPELVFDPEGLHRAVLNVVTNAIDACDATDDGIVEVASEFVPAERVARILVSDNGSRIAPHALEKIFAIFVSRKGGRGTGLGLAVVHGIVEDHGGRLELAEPLLRGTEFSVMLCGDQLCAEEEIN